MSPQISDVVERLTMITIGQQRRKRERVMIHVKTGSNRLREIYLDE